MFAEHLGGLVSYFSDAVPPHGRVLREPKITVCFLGARLRGLQQPDVLLALVFMNDVAHLQRIELDGGLRLKR